MWQKELKKRNKAEKSKLDGPHLKKKLSIERRHLGKNRRQQEIRTKKESVGRPQGKNQIPKQEKMRKIGERGESVLRRNHASQNSLFLTIN